MATVSRKPKARARPGSRPGKAKSPKGRAPKPRKPGQGSKPKPAARPPRRAPAKASPSSRPRPARAAGKAAPAHAAPTRARTPAPAAPGSATAPSPTAREHKPSARNRAAARTAADVVAGMSLRRLSHLAANDWEDLMAMADMDGVRAYAMRGQYARGEVIRHKVFGLGIVVRELGGTKIQVSFRDGVRLLVCNRTR